MRRAPALVVTVLASALLLAACGGSASTSGAAGPPGGVAAPAGGVSTDGGTSGSVSAGGGVGAASAGGSSAAGATGAARAPGGPLLPSGPDVVEDASVAVRVSAARLVAGDVARLSGVATRDGGFVQASHLTRGRHASAALTLRVPDLQLASTLSAIESLGTVRSVSEQGTDVTGQVVNLAVEERDLQAEETAVRAILARASRVADVLTIQEELFSIQQQADEVAATRAQLAGQVAYATVDAALTSAVPPPPARPRPGVLERAATLAVDNTVAAADALVLAAGWAAPLLGVAVVGGAVTLTVLRRRRRRLSPPAA